MDRTAPYITLLAALILVTGCNDPTPPPTQKKPSAIKDKMAKRPGLGPGAGSTRSTATDQEPNNDSTTALVLEPKPEPRSRLSVTGTLDKGAADVDMYKLPGTLAGQLFSLTVAPQQATPAQDLKVRLTIDPTSQSGDLFDLGNAGVSETLPNLRVPSQGMFITVTGVGDADIPYRLELSSRNKQDTIESEPNGEDALAIPLKPGPVVTGWLNNNNDVDFFIIKGTPADRPLLIRITPPSVAPMQVDLTHMNDPETELWSATLKDGKTLVFRGLRPDPDGYRVRIHAIEEIKRPQLYRVQLEAIKGTGNFELEPNNIREEAQQLTLKNQTLKVKGSITDAEDVDHFHLDVPATQAGEDRILSVRVTPTQKVLDVALAINWVEETMELRLDDGSAGEPEALCNVALPAAATLDMDIRAKAFGDLDPSQHERGYQLIAEVRAAGKEEREPNPIAPRATPLPLAQPMEGYIHPRGDVDVYKIEVPGDSSAVPLTVELNSGYAANLKLTLKDDQSGDVAKADRGLAGESETLRADVPPGTYYLHVSAHALASCTRPYELKATLPNVGAAPTPTPEQTPPTSPKTPTLDDDGF